ncbi:MAG TPA: helix-turn-helix domain-containing protein [Tepidisphaeraceae bacterium]|jgi:antitoxin component HigA of HigAB toxin-antitoxin module|nr:helix-turn-helix domain-containing protein [Tepidisphaeraceae bacterium]
MKSALLDTLPKSFAELNELHQLRPITSASDLAQAHDLIDRLAILTKRTKDQNNYLETLILLAEKYEADEIADALDTSKSSPLDALRYLMQIHQTRQTDLAKILGVGPSTVSMILSGDRPLTATHARNLAKHFSLSPAAFL